MSSPFDTAAWAALLPPSRAASEFDGIENTRTGFRSMVQILTNGNICLPLRVSPVFLSVSALRYYGNIIDLLQLSPTSNLLSNQILSLFSPTDAGAFGPGSAVPMELSEPLKSAAGRPMFDIRRRRFNSPRSRLASN